MKHFRTNGLLVEQGGLFELGTDESPMMEKATIYIKDSHDQPGGRNIERDCKGNFKKNVLGIRYFRFYRIKCEVTHVEFIQHGVHLFFTAFYSAFKRYPQISLMIS